MYKAKMMTAALLGAVLSASSPAQETLHFSTVAGLADFARANADNDFDRAWLVVAYIASQMDPRLGNQPQPAPGADGVLAANWAACGGRDYVLSAVLDELGIPARRIGFDRVPIQVGHVATEIMIDGDWVLFDSTFGLYFTDTRSGDPLSAGEARENYPANTSLHLISAPLWRMTALNSSDLGYEVFQPGTWPSEIYSHHRPAPGLPAALLAETYFISEMWGSTAGGRYDDNRNPSFDVDALPVVWGERDGSVADQRTQRRVGDVVAHSVLPERVGMFAQGNIRQTFRLTAQEDTRVSLVVDLVNGSPTDSNFFVDVDHLAISAAMQDVPEIEYGADGMATRVRANFLVRAPETEVFLSAPWGTVHLIDQIAWQQEEPDR